ncbi:MAG: MMPL family transporter, partial [Gammaproteobacteria bacterium]
PDDPQLITYERLENTYTKDDSVMLVVAPADGEVFSPHVLSLVEALTEKAWQIPYSNRVDSITNYQHTEAREDDLVVTDLVENAANLTAAELARLRAIALAEPQLRGFLLAPDARVTAVNVNILLPGVDEVAEQPRMIAYVRELVAAFATEYPDVDIYISGMGAFHVATSESAIQDMNIRAPISFAVMFALIAFLAGGFAGTVAALFVFSMSVAGAMGLSGYLGFPITPTGAGAPNIILTVAVANSVHILISYLHNLGEGQGQREAVEESLRINMSPVGLASITTAVGFMALNFSESPPFQMLGTTVAMGVLISLVLSLTFLPALLTVLPAGRSQRKSAEDAGVQRLGDFVVRQRARLLWGMGLVVAILFANIPRNDLNDRFLEFFDETIEFRVATDFMLDNLTGLYSIHYSLESGEPGGISDPEFLALTDEFAAWWRSQPETRHVYSITDTLKRLNKNMHGDEPAAYALPDSRNLAAQYLLLYEMSLPYGLDLNNQINVDKSATRVVATLDPISVTQTLDITRRAARWLDRHAPGIDHEDGSGMVMMFTHLFQRNISAMLAGTTAALVVISLIIMVALRSVRTGALSLVTNLAPIGMGFGIWALIDGKVGLALSLVASMTFGIVVDDT